MFSGNFTEKKKERYREVYFLCTVVWVSVAVGSRIPQIVDAQVPSIKWQSTVSPSVSSDVEPANMEGRLYAVLWLQIGFYKVCVAFLEL